ncbi:ABC transporter ATP-binding protein [Paenibacillus sp. S150]|uniref:ABC transporter ATP-binding protein n=1 Tax=Paenibacillus sp. S150 TaxID=2749826 RepID=UPI001C5A29C0|nr:ABC transporter ATP-binding protein [Paenibacillus sp. S150]MBW4083645.1 ABC transporter ATP-binding protein [Paenibacillus sp. S150]
MNKQPLLEVKQLKTHFHSDRNKVTAVNGVSFNMQDGEIIGIVGESGCGKSVMSQSIIRLLDHTDSVEYEGEVLLDGENLLALSAAKMRKVRGDKVAIIFQDPLTSLNPVYTIGNQIEEVIRLHKKVSRKEARLRTIELLRMTGIPSPERRADEYPHQLSGGMQQRVMIAMALACEPKLLIADEPTTALDVTIQAQILELIARLNRELGMGVLFITHDLGVVNEICTSVKVMYLGQIVEEMETDRLFESPLHPYTQGLIQSIPKPDGNRHDELHVIEGTVPSLSRVPRGCGFSTRCPYADKKCQEEEPPMESAHSKHLVKCWHYAAIRSRERGPIHDVAGREVSSS